MSAKIYKVCKRHGLLTRKQVNIVGIKKVFVRCTQCRLDYDKQYRKLPHVIKSRRIKGQKYNAILVEKLREPYLKDLCISHYNLKGRKNVTRQMITKMRQQVIARRTRLASQL